MHDKYNMMPADAIKIDILSIPDICSFFKHNFDIEYREPAYNEKDEDSDTFSLKIFWMDKHNNIGFGIVFDWQNDDIQWYQFGSITTWSDFKNSINNSQH